MIKRLKLNLLSKRGGVTKIASLKEGDEFVKALIGKDNDEVLIATEQGLYVRYKLDLIRPSGKTARGVIAMKLKQEGDKVFTMTTIKDSDDLVVVTEQGIGKRTAAKDYGASKTKGGKGQILYKSNNRTGKVAALLTVNDENLLITTANASVIRLDSNSLSKLTKAAMGNKLINLNDGDEVVSVAKIVPQQESEENLNE